MRFSLGKSMLRIGLLALFVTCLGLYMTTGQASAHSSWDNGCDSHGHHDSHYDCYGDGGNYRGRYSYSVSDNCDSFDPKTGFCLHWRIYIPGVGNQSSDSTCDAWDPNTGDCTHGSSGSYNNNGYYTNSYNANYHDTEYYYRYYCDRYHVSCN